MSNASTFVRQQYLKHLSDAELFKLNDSFPAIGSLIGYSSDAILSHAKSLAAIRSELYLRALIPAN